MKRFFLLYFLSLSVALQLESAEPTAFDQVNQCIAEEKWSDALVRLNDILEKEPGNIRALALRGNLLFHRKEYAFAEGDFSAIIELLPDHANAYASRAIVYHAMGYKLAALDDINKARTLKPDSAFVYKVKTMLEKDAPIKLKNGPVSLKRGGVAIKNKRKR